MSARRFEVVPGAWKFACAIAVLVGHNLVSLVAWRPDEAIWTGVYHLVQFFSPLHFFFFSGFLAAAMLLDARKTLLQAVLSRGVRIYALIVTALLLGLAARLVFKSWSGVDALGEVWPLPYWDGSTDWVEVLRHLNPLGFADHVSFNYAVWYLYQEFRLLLLFPLLRWILLRPALSGRVAGLVVVLAGATILEFLFWSWFPLFRSSPFQTLGYSGIFLSGAIVWMELRPGGVLHRMGPRTAMGMFLVGVVISFSESAGIRPPLDNPIVLLIPTLVGQSLAVAGLSRLIGHLESGPLLRKACDASVGIYIVHPPIHMIFLWWAIQRDSPALLLVGVVLSLIAGWLYHAYVELPSQRLAKVFAVRRE